MIVAGNVWVYDLNGRPPIKLTFDGDGSSFTPLWTPDGAGIVYESSKGGLAVVRADGSTGAAAIASPAGHFHPAGWLAGGREVVATQLGTPTLTDVVMFVPDAKAEVVPVVRTEAVEGFQGVSVSPDGKWIAYTSDVTGRTEVWVRRYPGPGAPLPVSANGGAEPQWSRDGRELYFIGDRDTIMMAAINPGPQLSFRPPVTLFQTSFMRAGQPPSYDVTPDGRFVFVRRGENRSAETNLIVELNWLEELKQRVPTN